MANADQKRREQFARGDIAYERTQVGTRTGGEPLYRYRKLRILDVLRDAARCRIDGENKEAVIRLPQLITQAQKDVIDGKQPEPSTKRTHSSSKEAFTAKLGDVVKLSHPINAVVTAVQQPRPAPEPPPKQLAASFEKAKEADHRSSFSPPPPAPVEEGRHVPALVRAHATATDGSPYPRTRIGDFIYEKRMAAKMKQHEVGAILGLPLGQIQTFVSEIETYSKVFQSPRDDDKLIRLAGWTKTSLQDLIKMQQLDFQERKAWWDLRRQAANKKAGRSRSRNARASRPNVPPTTAPVKDAAKENHMDHDIIKREREAMDELLREAAEAENKAHLQSMTISEEVLPPLEKLAPLPPVNRAPAANAEQFRAVYAKLQEIVPPPMDDAKHDEWSKHIRALAKLATEG